MPRAKQLTLSVADRPGMLGEIATALGEKKVNIVGLCAATQAGGGMIWLVVDKPAAAKKVFAQHRWQSTEEDVPFLALSPLGPYYLEGGPARTRMPQRLDKNLSHVGSADSVFETERIFALADFDRSLASRAIRQKTGSNNRVIKPAPPISSSASFRHFKCFP